MARALNQFGILDHDFALFMRTDIAHDRIFVTFQPDDKQVAGRRVFQQNIASGLCQLFIVCKLDGGDGIVIAGISRKDRIRNARAYGTRTGAGFHDITEKIAAVLLFIRKGNIVTCYSCCNI